MFNRITLISLLIALALMLYYVEGIIPPLPGLPWTRLGLTNLVTLLSLVFLSFKETFFIVLFRVVVGTLITGIFLTPPFWLSLAGAVTSTLTMGLVYYHSSKRKASCLIPSLSSRKKCFSTAASEINPPLESENKYPSPKKGPFFSLVGISVVGAVVHNLTQLTVVAEFYVRSTSTFLLTPFMIFTGLIAGFITGILAEFVLQRLEKNLL